MTTIEDFRQKCRDLTDPGIDPLCLPLLKAMNQLPGIYTSESCSGHDKQPFQVFFHVEAQEQRGLFVLAWCTDRRYFEHGSEWNISLEVSDLPPAYEGALTYVLSTSYVDEKTAYQQSLDIAEYLHEKQADQNWRSYFGV